MVMKAKANQVNRVESEMNERKAIFITGGASGIGRAVAIRFAEQGWFVGLGDINEKGMAETLSMLPGGEGFSCKLDVRDRKAWDTALAAFTKKSGGRLDVLFNNAGIGHGGLFEAVRHEEHDIMMDINIKGVVWGAEAAFEYLRKTPGSCLLNTASAAGIYGPANLAVYGASKFAVRGLTEALDVEWDKYGIKVCSLMPGFIDTPILDGLNSTSNRSTRETITYAGMEISPVSIAADAAWNAVHGDAVHVRVGETAKRAWFMAKWLPGVFRKGAKKAGGTPL
jgi:NAD(P)-dependent dehydrogenase (short-subunit alcohol dehydrogenase family)